jgi:hypothetical protein
LSLPDLIIRSSALKEEQVAEVFKVKPFNHKDEPTYRVIAKSSRSMRDLKL